ncbi:hypothetical protein PANT111_190221 [Pantoea brenneri]|uniref:Transposase n=1 Tax=Pantoea brenneri TaxID=472694 RepID=A0AAX3J696_9GAMM|nr:hypothetical protein PANT111_190221 [Pantoea brenneri]
MGIWSPIHVKSSTHANSNKAAKAAFFVTSGVDSGEIENAQGTRSDRTEQAQGVYAPQRRKTRQPWQAQRGQ